MKTTMLMTEVRRSWRSLLACCVVACTVSSFAAKAPQKEKPLDFTGAFPPSVKTIGLVMPASIQPQRNFERGVAALEAAGYKVKRAKRLNFKTVASVEDRVADFEEAWMDPEVDLVLCARGGTGAQDLLEKIDWAKLRTRPQQRVLGFSNITMLLNAMLKEKVGIPFSGPSLSHFLYADPQSFKWLAPAIDRGPLPDVQLKALRPGACKGTAVGGHIMLVSKAVSMGWAPDAKGKIVFLESSANYPPVIRSTLNGLVKKGYFNACAGVVFGDITPSGRKLKRLSGAELEEGRAAVAQIKKDFAAQVTCPVWDDYPYGHVPVSYAIDHLREKTITEDGVLKQ